MNKMIEFDEQCGACGGTGLYVGLAERDGSAVVCHECRGTGCHHFWRQYKEFSGRRTRPGVVRVMRSNPGIVMGKGGDRRYSLSDFGGITHEAWERLDAPDAFPPKTEMRAFTCPAY